MRSENSLNTAPSCATSMAVSGRSGAAHRKSCSKTYLIVLYSTAALLHAAISASRCC